MHYVPWRYTFQIEGKEQVNKAKFLTLRVALTFTSGKSFSQKLDLMLHFFYGGGFLGGNTD